MEFVVHVSPSLFHQHETAEGGHQAIRITRFTENIFLPARKLGASLAKGKVGTTAEPAWLMMG